MIYHKKIAWFETITLLFAVIMGVVIFGARYIVLVQNSKLLYLQKVCRYGVKP
jgi:hypothetical protein